MRRLLAGTVIALGHVATASAAVPAGFTEEAYSSNLLAPSTGAAWAPDGSGRLFVLNKNGIVRVVRTEAGRPKTTGAGQSTLEVSTFATEPSVHTESEGGLLGIAFDPNYIVNRYLYVFVSVSPSEQRIARWTDSGGGIDAAGVGIDRTPIVSGLPTAGQTHVGGGLTIGADGKLYFGIGDLGNGTGVDADLTSLASKIGRANLDGTPVTDNPFNDGVGPNNEYIWARGLRNPFGLAMQPATGSIWAAVAGSAYEQLFRLGPRAHAGFNDYENNQEGPDSVTPKLVYRTNSTDQRTITSAVRAGGTLTVTTTARHGFRVGQAIELAGLGAGFVGDVYVASVPSDTTFTAAQAGANATATLNDAYARTKFLGGAITRGTFYESNAFPAEYRGNYFFGDYNSGYLIRAAMSSSHEIARVDVWGSEFATMVQAVTGDDGSLYALGYSNGVLRRIRPTSPSPKLIVGNARPYVLEGGRAAFTVALATAPAANLTVTVARSSGDADIDVVSGGTLTFTPTDWAQPRPVVLAAAVDADSVVDVSTFDVSAPGMTTERVVATSIENNDAQLVLSTNTLDVPEGGTATVSVSWSKRPTRSTIVTVRRVSGDEDVTVEEPTTLSFTAANWNTPQTVTIAAAQDDDNVAGRALISFGSAFSAQLLEVTEVDDEAPPPTPDAGADGGGTADAGGTPDAAGPDAGGPNEPPPDDEPQPSAPNAPGPAAGESDGAEPQDGCNCNTHGRAGSGALWLAVALLLARRRRSR